MDQSHDSHKIGYEERWQINVHPSQEFRAEQRKRLNLRDNTESILDILKRLRPQETQNDTTYKWGHESTNMMVFQKHRDLCITHRVVTTSILGYGPVVWKILVHPFRDYMITATPEIQNKKKSRNLIAAATWIYRPNTVVFATKTKEQDLQELVARAYKTMDLTTTDRGNLHAMFDVLGPRITSMEEARHMLIGATTAILEIYPSRRLPKTFDSNSGFRITGDYETHKFSHPTIDPMESLHWRLGRQAMYIMTHHQPGTKKPSPNIAVRPPVPILPRPRYVTWSVD